MKKYTIEMKKENVKDASDKEDAEASAEKIKKEAEKFARDLIEEKPELFKNELDAFDSIGVGVVVEEDGFFNELYEQSEDFVFDSFGTFRTEAITELCKNNKGRVAFLYSVTPDGLYTFYNLSYGVAEYNSRDYAEKLFDSGIVIL